MGRRGQEVGKDGRRRLEEAKATLRRGGLCSPGWGSAGMGGTAGLGWVLSQQTGFRARLRTSRPHQRVPGEGRVLFRCLKAGIWP